MPVTSTDKLVYFGLESQCWPAIAPVCSLSDQMSVRHEVAISTVILEFQEITLRSAVSTLPGHASPATAGCEALGTI
jgi:hypothetical protein